MFDKDMSGTIELHEFQSLWNYIQQWKGVFEQFDQNRSGAIDFNELCNGEYIFLLVSSCCLVGFTCLFESCIGSTHFKGLSLKKNLFTKHLICYTEIKYCGLRCLLYINHNVYPHHISRER